MAKKQDGGTAVVIVKNLSPGPRDYPLKDGASIYLPPKGKGIAWPEVSPDQVSEAMLLAEKKGTIEIIARKAPEMPKEVSE